MDRRANKRRYLVLLVVGYVLWSSPLYAQSDRAIRRLENEVRRLKAEVRKLQTNTSAALGTADSEIQKLQTDTSLALSTADAAIRRLQTDTSLALVTADDAASAVYGDGSDGDLVVASDSPLEKSDGQYASVVINQGATLTVAAGSIIRCTGSFLNNGNVVVQTFEQEGDLREMYFLGDNDRRSGVAGRFGDQGLSRRPAEFGTYDSGGGAGGGYGGLALQTGLAKLLLKSSYVGGGEGGGGAFVYGVSNGGNGGGTILIICGSVTNAATGYTTGRRRLWG